MNIAIFLMRKFRFREMKEQVDSLRDRVNLELCDLEDYKSPTAY